MYCHATTYCQKAFVPSMCAHCSTYYQLMLNPEKSLSLFLLSSLGQVPFYLSVLLYSWLLCSCASSRTAALYAEDVVIIFCLLYVFLLSFFSAFCWQLIYSFQEKRIASVNFSAMETNHFFLLLNLLLLMFDSFVL